MKRCSSTLVFLLFTHALMAQMEDIIGGDGYRQEQAPGLNQSASKIFYSSKPYSFSVWGEFNGVVPIRGERDTSSGELELYYGNLNRVTGYFSVKPAKSIVLTIEGQLEVLVGNGETQVEFLPEFYFDFLGNHYFNMRFGLSPLHIGYINNNDEPLLFYSVNRPETERLIIPTEWIEFGLHFYGDIIKDKLHYALAFTNGPEAKDFVSPTWIRGGKEGRVDLHDIAINPQIEYSGIDNLFLSLSGYFGRTGQGEQVIEDTTFVDVKAALNIVSGYARWDWKDLRAILMGTWGKLGETDKVFTLTEEQTGNAQVIGETVYGYYLEAGWDFFGPKRRQFHETNGEDKGFLRRDEQSLVFFTRFEQLNTHASVIPSLSAQLFNSNDLQLIVLGMNYKPRENLVLKADYVIRTNRSANEGANSDNDLFEFGLGFAF